MGHLHPQSLRGVSLAVIHFQQRDPHRFLVNGGVVQHGRSGGGGQPDGVGQRAVAQQEAPGRRGHHVTHPVFGVLFQDILGRFGKVNQQAGANRLDLAGQRAHRLGEGLVNAFFGIAQGHAVSQCAAHQPQHQLRQHQPQQQLTLQGQAVRGRGAHSAAVSSM